MDEPGIDRIYWPNFTWLATGNAEWVQPRFRATRPPPSAFASSGSGVVVERVVAAPFSGPRARPGAPDQRSFVLAIVARIPEERARCGHPPDARHKLVGGVDALNKHGDQFLKSLRICRGDGIRDRCGDVSVALEGHQLVVIWQASKLALGLRSLLAVLGLSQVTPGVELSQLGDAAPKACSLLIGV
jgi:hypothetical protein